MRRERERRRRGGVGKEGGEGKAIRKRKIGRSEEERREGGGVCLELI
jgi:hypothetical protein